ncbi:hypothetical protein [Paucisalibacillus globulus]|uniref:hypothetical protein n=1 Tax=Paucisalibacillus globulus TaxID=351095 RepID=UPI0003F9BC53|nr:hypothetical protein [Paucisalibacillus globulus]
MNHTLFHNTSIRKLEKDYYQSYSADRYLNTDDSSFHILTPFSKEYINKDNQRYGHIEQYTQLIHDVIEHTLKIKRYDILSYYHDHNNSPSVRSLHTAKLLFLIDGLFYYYHIYDDQLLLVSQSEIDASIYMKDRLYIFGLSDVLNLTRFYSEFSLYASLLDAGHLLYNVKNVLVNKNIDFLQLQKFNSNYLYENIHIDSRYSYVSFALEISPEYKESQLMERIPYVTGHDKRLSVDHNELKPTKYLKEILAQYNSSLDREGRFINTHEIPSFQLTSTLIRNSAHTTIGNHNYGEKFEQFNPVDVLTILKDSKRIFSSNGMEYCFLIKSDIGEYIYWSDLTRTNLEIDFRKIMYDDHKFFDFKTYNIVFLCFSDKNKVIENGLQNQLITASEMMQLVALYSSSISYAFRPMKNHNDYYLKNILTLDEQYEINFMGVVCNSPIQQLSYYLK